MAPFTLLRFAEENWCIKYLDIDESLPTDNLDEEIERYPEYKIHMNRLNNYYITSVYFALFMMITNFVVSGVTVYQSYAGSNSVSTFISFFMLVSMKLYSAWGVGTLSIRDERANSAYLKEPKTYNTIDSDFKIEEQDPLVESKVDVNVREI